jgi:hypothetical protein
MMRGKDNYTDWKVHIIFIVFADYKERFHLSIFRCIPRARMTMDRSHLVGRIHHQNPCTQETIILWVRINIFIITLFIFNQVHFLAWFCWKFEANLNRWLLSLFPGTYKYWCRKRKLGCKQTNVVLEPMIEP